MSTIFKHVPGVFKHINCRNGIYPKTKDVKRFLVPDDYVFWSVPYPQYNAVPIYSLPGISANSWADPDEIGNDFKPKFNAIDGNINRTSYNGTYELDDGGYPVNPIGRTGLRGRGLLGRWGPNHAADAIVTRWKHNSAGRCCISSTTQKSILEVVTIKRRDNGMWAIPGGMVDPGEKAEKTLQREFFEEAVCNPEDDLIIDLFKEGVHAYKGYVDDPRNTDNAWIETLAVNFHDDDGITKRMKLSARDDAVDVKWTDIDRSLDLHANHNEILEQVAKIRDAHW